jgi:hypothetical protein
MERAPQRALALLVAVLAGCGGDDSQPAPRPVTVRLELGDEHPAETIASADHADRAVPVLSTRGRRLVLRGTVEPATSEVRLLDGATLGQSATARRHGRRFAFTIEDLHPGENRYVLDASDAGHRAWRRIVRVVSQAPRRPMPRTVVVPRTDRTPGEAELHLDRRRLVATAIGRDPEGLARIRVSADLRLRCRSAEGEVTEVPFLRYDPPAAVGETRIAPGARAPTRMRRRSDLRAAAKARCAENGATLSGLHGIVWADATNAHALDRYSADVHVGASRRGQATREP